MTLIKMAVQNFFRNFWLTVTSIIIMLLMFCCLTIIYSFNVLGQQVLDSFSQKMDLSIYFQQNADQNRLAILRSTLENLPEVKESYYLTAEESLAKFREKHQKDPLILKSLESLNENPFGAVINLKFYNPSDYQKIITLISSPNYQDLIQDQNFYDYQKLIQTFNKINLKIVRSGLALSSIFILIAILVIFTTIKLGALSRKREIKIMRLVGASAWTIRAPFLIEGALYSFIAWILNLAIILPLSYVLHPSLKQFLELDFNLFNYLKTNSFLFWIELLIFGLIISLVGSNLAIKKYLKT